MKISVRTSAALVFLTLTILLVMAASPQDEPKPRQIVIVAKEMAFFFENRTEQDSVNPTIIVRAGERITLILRNEDPGMRHDLVIADLGLRTRVTSYGETATLTFRVPGDPGAYAYLCSLHPAMMTGELVVE